MFDEYPGQDSKSSSGFGENLAQDSEIRILLRIWKESRSGYIRNTISDSRRILRKFRSVLKEKLEQIRKEFCSKLRRILLNILRESCSMFQNNPTRDSDIIFLRIKNISD